MVDASTHDLMISMIAGVCKAACCNRKHQSGLEAGRHDREASFKKEAGEALRSLPFLLLPLAVQTTLGAQQHDYNAPVQCRGGREAGGGRDLSLRCKRAGLILALLMDLRSCQSTQLAF
jgi:hypothetical protein